MMFGDRGPGQADQEGLGQHDANIPRIACYPGDLKSGCGPHHENAVQAIQSRTVPARLSIRSSLLGWTRRHGPVDGVCVEIGDDGPGIPPDVVDRIFTLFTTKPFGRAPGSV